MALHLIMSERPWRRTYESMIGKTFGRLCVIDLHRSDKLPVFSVKCSCGSTFQVQASSVSTGHTQSCGCLHREATRAAKTIHGCAPKGNGRTPEYKAWLGMRRRCNAKEGTRNFEWYSKRGIIVCDRWNDFSKFLEDIGPKPSHVHSLDRIDNNGNYEPGNVRWASVEEQARNKRTTRLSKDRVDAMRLLHKNGASPREICDAGKCSYRTMRKVVTYKVWK